MVLARVLDPLEDDSYASADCKVLHTTWLKVRPLLSVEV